MIVINEAKFITSATSLQSSPQTGLSEVVFLGRSNVGKSSFINSITGHKNLAKSSQTPGKTRLINFFEVRATKESLSEKKECRFMMVDLPGYGYAKVSKKTQDEWRITLDEFLQNRVNIKLFIHLIDARHFDLEIDREVDSYINKILLPTQNLLRVYTKCDKINQSSRAKLLNSDKNALFSSTLKPRNLDHLREVIIDGVLESV
ncbi:ribosome biogenesis GTP-binding protein YihA/YsxC [uncultured Campylobacter sp.]|uniref:ribosome biogenesis GTP-binding protein YihA/YsxC n=1 Tax=uncultured Campylobacter sp. TaxID=218934 RepID=UPI00261EFBBB|nr:ribosome biogenesis GTP-binding protein YihA/YsxC [uncultured Campylobacter sp.]